MDTPHSTQSYRETCKAKAVNQLLGGGGVWTGPSSWIAWRWKLSAVINADSGGVRERTEITLGVLDRGRYTL